MRVAHCVTVSPNRCGLYGTTKDLVRAERMVGIDAGVIDVHISKNEPIINGWQETYKKIKDEELVPKSIEWARKADVFIKHTYIPMELQSLGKPLLLALHGRPESSFQLEMIGQVNVLSHVQKRTADKRYKGFICFWKEFLSFWSFIVPEEKLFYVPAPVDLEYYSPKGDVFDFKKHNGSPNILIPDIWREDVTPFNLLDSATRFQQYFCKTAKIHILTIHGRRLKVLGGILSGMKRVGALGVIMPMIKNIRELYRAADIVITPHIISTRIVRESLACGTPIVAGTGNQYTPYSANPMHPYAFAKAIKECWDDITSDPNTIKSMARKTAEMAFNLERTGKAMKKVLENLV